MNESLFDFISANVNSVSTLFFACGYFCGIFVSAFGYLCDELSYYLRNKRKNEVKK